MKHIQHILLLIFLLLMVGVVVATDTNTTIVYPTPNVTEVSYAVVEVPPPLPTPAPIEIRRINQGDCVALNETVDIAGIGWYTGTIAYYGKWFDDYAGTGVQTQALYYPSPQDIKHLYIDPSFFGNHTGWWYSYYYGEGTNTTFVDISYRSAGYDRLFKVQQSCALTPLQNASAVIEALNASQLNAMKLANMTTLTIKKEENVDLIVAKGADVEYNNMFGEQREWLFGRESSDRFYDIAISDNMTSFKGTDTVDMEAGWYDAIFITPGRNTIIEENYDPKIRAITSPFRSQTDTIANGSQSKLVEEMLLNRISNSYDDSYNRMRIDLQDPNIDVIKLSQTPLLYNKTAFVVKGYTNENPGEVFTITIDSGIPRVTGRDVEYATVVNNGGASAYRAWNSSFIMDMNNMFPGQHSMTITGTLGEKAIIPFYVYYELAKHHQDESYAEFIGNSPFIPTPTPEVRIQKVEVPVVVTVTVPVPPTQESVDQAFWNGMWGMVMYGLFVAIVLLVVGYFVVAWVRGRNKGRRF